MKSLFAALVLVLLAGTAQAQARASASASAPVPKGRYVAFEGKALDPIGERLLRLVRQRVERSSPARYQESGVTGMVMLRISTMESVKGQSTGYSAVWTLAGNDVYMSHGVGLCLVKTLDACADTLVEQTDAMLDTLAR